MLQLLPRCCRRLCRASHAAQTGQCLRVGHTFPSHGKRKLRGGESGYGGVSAGDLSPSHTWSPCLDTTVPPGTCRSVTRLSNSDGSWEGKDRIKTRSLETKRRPCGPCEPMATATGHSPQTTATRTGLEDATSIKPVTRAQDDKHQQTQQSQKCILTFSRIYAAERGFHFGEKGDLLNEWCWPNWQRSWAGRPFPTSPPGRKGLPHWAEAHPGARGRGPWKAGAQGREKSSVFKATVHSKSRTEPPGQLPGHQWKMTDPVVSSKGTQTQAWARGTNPSLGTGLPASHSKA